MGGGGEPTCEKHDLDPSHLQLPYMAVLINGDRQRAISCNALDY